MTTAQGSGKVVVDGWVGVVSNEVVPSISSTSGVLPPASGSGRGTRSLFFGLLLPEVPCPAWKSSVVVGLQFEISHHNTAREFT